MNTELIYLGNGIFLTLRGHEARISFDYKPISFGHGFMGYENNENLNRSSALRTIKYELVGMLESPNTNPARIKDIREMLEVINKRMGLEPDDVEHFGDFLQNEGLQIIENPPRISSQTNIEFN